MKVLSVLSLIFITALLTSHAQAQSAAAATDNPDTYGPGWGTSSGNTAGGGSGFKNLQEKEKVYAYGGLSGLYSLFSGTTFLGFVTMDLGRVVGINHVNLDAPISDAVRSLFRGDFYAYMDEEGVNRIITK